MFDTANENDEARAKSDVFTNLELVIQQIEVESNALDHVTRALECILSWTADAEGYTRKLSSVRFFAELYQRHVEHLFSLEEIDGYMEGVSRLSPELTNQVDQLKREHEQFRGALRKSVIRLGLASPTDTAQFDVTCRELRIEINAILEHIRRENDLLVESLQHDIGGEG